MQGGVSGWTLGKIYSKSGDALAESAQGSAGVSVPGGAQE